MVRQLLYLLVFLAFLTSCTRNNSSTPPPQPAAKEENAPETIDLGCSYFYFLWGTQAEYTENYEAALEAYEKALICDPSITYIKEKIPVLLLKMGEQEKASQWLRKAIRLEPANDSYRLLLASLAIQQEHFDEAIETCQTILKREPKNETVLLRLGLLYGQMDQAEEAEQIFRQILAGDKNSYFAHVSLARALKEQDKNDEAGKEYEIALQLNWSKELAFEIGYFYHTSKRLEDALRIYTTVTDNDQLDEQGALSRVQILMDLNRIPEAVDALKTVRTFSDNPRQIDLIYAKILIRQNSIAEAKKILEELANHSNLIESRYLLALLIYQEGDLQKARYYLSTIKPSDDVFEDAVYMEIRILQQQKKVEEAIRLLEKYLSSDESRNVTFYTLLSSIFQQQHKQQLAIQTLESALGFFPDDPDLLYEYGIAMEKNGMSGRAVEIMEKLLSIDPNHGDALNYIGYTWADQSINLKKALEYIKQANDLKPDNGYIVDSLGWVYFRLGRYGEAIRALKRAIELENKDPHIYEHLGDVYNAQKDIANARKMYEKALSMQNETEEKTLLLKKLEILKTKK